MSRTIGILATIAISMTAGIGSLCCFAADSALAGMADTTEQIISIGQHDNKAMDHLDHLVNDIGSRPANTLNCLKAYRWAREKFREFGLANVHLEKHGEMKGEFSSKRESRRFERLYRKLFSEDLDSDMVPICNVIADIPGTERPDEYVIVGAHLDSAPQGPGATDNGAGVAAVIEAARILAESNAEPHRTIRFMLFGGEEVGLVGSKGYVEDHPEMIPKISAVYNMDHGASYISGIMATESLRADMDKIFAAAAGLDPQMPFEVKEVEFLPQADHNCCASMVQTPAGESGTERIVTTTGSGARVSGSEQVVTSAGSGAGASGSEHVVTVSGCGAASSCAGAIGGTIGPGKTIKQVTADGDTVVMQIFVSGAPGGGENLDLSNLDLSSLDLGNHNPENLDLANLDLKALGIAPEQLASGDRSVGKVVAIGSSDHAPFLAAGVPAFWWIQEESLSKPYPAHTPEDTFDKVNAQDLEHSALVIALGALVTADLDHMLSREKLTAPEVEANRSTEANPSGGCSPSCGSKAIKSQ